MLDIHERMLFALLRASLQDKDVELDFFRDASSHDWEQCYRLSVQESVMALAWDGVLRLPQELLPPRALKISWGVAADAYRQRYHHFCKTVNEISALYGRYGIGTVVLKGVGLSVLYPNPMCRKGVDIDIYTYSSDKKRMSDIDAALLADNIMRTKGIDVDSEHSYKHSSFYYNGVHIENHKTFLNVSESGSAAQAEKILKNCMSPQYACLPEGKILVPSPQFNSLFVAFHAAQHYCVGLSLQHLCDLAIIFKHYGWIMPEEFADKNILRAFKAFAYLCNMLLGISVKTDYMVGVEDLAEEMLDEILHPRYNRKIPPEFRLGTVVYKARRMLYRYRLRRRIFPDSFYCRLRFLFSGNGCGKLL